MRVTASGPTGSRGLLAEHRSGGGTLERLEDAKHHVDALHRMLADSCLSGEDQSMRPVIEGVDDVVRLRDRWSPMSVNRLEQIPRDQHRRVKRIRTADVVHLVKGQVFDRHLT